MGTSTGVSPTMRAVFRVTALAARLLAVAVLVGACGAPPEPLPTAPPEAAAAAVQRPSTRRPRRRCTRRPPVACPGAAIRRPGFPGIRHRASQVSAPPRPHLPTVTPAPTTPRRSPRRDARTARARPRSSRWSAPGPVSRPVRAWTSSRDRSARVRGSSPCGRSRQETRRSRSAAGRHHRPALGPRPSSRPAPTSAAATSRRTRPSGIRVLACGS